MISWPQLQSACHTCPDYQDLVKAVLTSDTNLLEKPHLSPYKKVFPELTMLRKVVMLNNRIVVPKSYRPAILQFLHAAHAGVPTMLARAAQSVYWPGFKKDIELTRTSCLSCNRNAPSNPATFLTPSPSLPSYPFQEVCADFFEWQSHTYLIIADRYSNWLSLVKLQNDTSKNLISALREYFAVFGIAETICTDGASVFLSEETQKFFQTWGIVHRVSSAYFAESNKRAELGVKAAKRLIRDNVGIQGSLNTNQFTQALLAHRNAPDPHNKVSPAEIVFGHKVRDIIPASSYEPSEHWVKFAADREACFLKRHYSKSERLDNKKRKLAELLPGNNVYVQDQTGKTPRKRTKSGVILESLPHNSFLVKLDGSGHVTRRNRQFLRSFTPFSQPSTSSPLNTTSSMSTPEISSLWMDAIDTPLQIASHMLPHSVSSISSLSPPPHDLEGASSTPGWSASAMGYPNPATVIGDQSWA